MDQSGLCLDSVCLRFILVQCLNNLPYFLQKWLAGHLTKMGTFIVCLKSKLAPSNEFCTEIKLSFVPFFHDFVQERALSASPSDTNKPQNNYQPTQAKCVTDGMCNF